MGGDAQLTGPDLAKGVPLTDLADGALLGGHALGQPVLLARRGDEIFAVGSQCTHYGGPLAEGILVGTTVRCPWHHACFDLRTGEATCAPAMRALPRFAVERSGNSIRVVKELGGDPPRGTPARSPKSVVIIGGGAAGDAAADMLRREGYDGPVTILSADADPPCDRPNLSKDYLAGNAPEEWIPLRPEGWYAERRITLVNDARALSIDTQARRVMLADGRAYSGDVLLIATGASPVRLPDDVTGGRVLYLRTLADCRTIIAAAESAKSALVLGASFIGLEVAASLRQRGLEVHVAAPESHPLERVMGRAVSDFIRARHERNGVTFHLGRAAGRVEEGAVTLDDGTRVKADLVVAGVGVRPNDALAKEAGIDTDNGILVNDRLETSVPGIYAAGDVARFPDARTGDRIRVEHWVHAQRMGQAAARNILGADAPFVDVPFFWSAHPDAQISYVGHASRFDSADVEGDLAAGDAVVRYRANGRVLAVATIGRDRDALEAERHMEEETLVTRGAA